MHRLHGGREPRGPQKGHDHPRRHNGQPLLVDKVPHLAKVRSVGRVEPGNLWARGLGGLPIPTTFLVDDEGKVAWIDQTDDYMLRSSPGRVLGAINETLD